MASATKGDPTTLQQIDRLVSASSPSDALESLQLIVISIRDAFSSCTSNSGDGGQLFHSISTLADSVEFTTTLCTLLSSSQIGRMTVEDGDSTASELLTQILTSLSSTETKSITSPVSQKAQLSILKKFLSQPSEGTLTSSILDLLSPTDSSSDITNSTPPSLYARTNALQALSQLTLVLPTLLHAQILSAPDGLHRIVDLLSNDSTKIYYDESIRNEAILVCTNLAKTSSASARLMIFSETYEKVLLGVAQEEFLAGIDAGGLGWTVVVGDCLELCVEMTRQDGMGAEVFLGSRSLVGVLARFLDLRFGRNFNNPEQSGTEIDDDLDAILGSGEKDTDINREPFTSGANIPYLTKEEAHVIKLALELLQILILGDDSNDMTAISANKTKRQSRQRSILSHITVPCLLFDMALYTLPPSDAPHSHYVSAVPPLDVQLKALCVMAALVHNSEEDVQSLILQKESSYLRGVGVLERLMYLVCTGGGDSRILSLNKEPLLQNALIQISMHALGVLRYVLSPKKASLMVLHTLTPPPPTDEVQSNSPLEVPVVQKLVNTLTDNLQVLINPDLVKQVPGKNIERMNVNIVGAAGALGVFLTNGAGETTREMLLRVPHSLQQSYESKEDDKKALNDLESSQRITSSNIIYQPESLVECILFYLEVISNENSENEGHSSQVAIALLRLLIEWTPSSPQLISALLASASSVALGVLLQKKYKKGRVPIVQALVGLLLGLCMENIDPEEEIGGWSRSSIMNLINVGMGISKFTQLLEGMKPVITSSGDSAVVGPWTCCKWERLIYLKWYEDNVNIVRRRAVQELTFSNSESESDDSGEENTLINGENDRNQDTKYSKSLSRLVSQQSAEIDVLREKLANAEQTLEDQSVEVKMWKKRMESNPTQLDNMLDEYSSKISQLEKEKKTLTDEVVAKGENHLDRLNEKDKEISQLQEVSQQRREEIIVVREEMDSVKQELACLSSAYTSLETEYNLLSTNSASVVQTVEASERTSSQSKVDSSNTEITSSSTFDDLKKENAKLKNDVRAANDWMNMAVKKNEELGNVNSKLQADIECISLKNSRVIESTANQKVEGVHLKEKLLIMKQKLDNTEHSFNDLKAQKDFEVNNIRVELTDELSQLKNELTEKNIALQSMEKCINNTEGQLLEPVTESTANQKVECVQALKDKLLRMEQKLDSTEHNFTDLKAQKDSEVDKIRVELTDKISLLKNELAEKNIALQSMVKRIDDAEGQLLEAVTNVDDGKGEIVSLRQDVKKLSTANKEARDWMANAVKHNESLKEQLVEAKQTQAELKSTLQEYQSSVAVEKRSQTKVSQMEEMVRGLTKIRDEVRDKLKSLELQLKAKEKELSETVTFEENESQKKLKEIESLKEKLLLHNDETQNLKKDITDLRGEFNIERLKVTNLEKALEEKSNAFDVVKQEKSDLNHEIELIKTDCEEERSDFTRLQNKIELVKADNDSLSSERNKHLSTIEDNRKSLEEKSCTIDLIQQEKSNFQREIEVVRTEREEQYTAFACLQSEIEVVKADNHSLASERDTHLSAIEDMRSRLTEFQSWTETAQQRISDLEVEKDNMNKSIKLMEEAKTSALEEAKTLSERMCEMKAINEKDALELEKLHSEAKDLKIKFDDERDELLVKVKSIEALEENIFEQKNLVIESEVKLKAIQKKLDEVRSANQILVHEKQDVLEKTEKLESLLENAEAKLEHQERARESAESQLTSKCLTLEVSLTNLSNEVQQLNSTIIEVENILGQEREINTLLAQEKNTVEQELQSCIGDLESATREHLGTIDDLQIQLDERDETVLCAEERIKTLTKELVESTDQSEDVVSKWQDNNQQLEATIAELELTIENQHVEANSAISEWEKRCIHLEEELNNDMTLSKISALELQVKQKNSEVELAQSKLTKLESTLADLNIKVREVDAKESVHVEVQRNLQALEDSYYELNEKLCCTQNILQNEVLAKSAIELKLQTAIKEKEQALKELEIANAVAKERKGILDSEEETLYELKIKLGNFESLLDKSKQKFENAELQRINDKKIYKDEKKEWCEKIQEWETEKCSMNRMIEDHKTEAHEMNTIIVELEGELQETNEVLQSHLTDEVTLRATEMATKALRVQLNDLREKHMSEHHAFVTEKEARLNAEEERERLQVDLSLLIQSVDGRGGESIDIRKLTSKTASDIVTKERVEIEDLRRSIECIMQDLSSCKAKEKDAEERAANCRLNASVSEQELIAAKSEVSFLKEALGNLRNDSTITKSSLEECIKKIEDESDVKEVTHAHEVEALKAEIVRCQMERERLVHALSESEKANSTLVYSTTVQKDVESFSDEMEFTKLQFEKAQLLASASENGSKFERRIREAVAANAASIEADVLLERELRESAEIALSELQKQCEELTSRLKKVDRASLSNKTSDIVTSTVSRDQPKIDEMKKEIKRLELEKHNLDVKCEKMEEDARTEVARLKNKCQQIEAKYREIAHEEHFEATVAAEVARINTGQSHQKLRDDLNLFNEENECKKRDMEAEEMYDHLVDLKESIKEEREMYNDLLTEHEDLLALLAQQEETIQHQKRLLKSAD